MSNEGDVVCKQTVQVGLVQAVHTGVAVGL
jgi:hypothetical protein